MNKEPDMTVDRRDFLLGTSIAAMGLMTMPATLNAQPTTQKKDAVLKLSSQLGIIPGNELDEKLARMQEWGFDAVELPGEIVGKEKMYQDAVAKTKLKISAVCWGSCNGDLVSDVAEKRPKAVDTLKRVLDSAGELKSTGVIFVPAFNGQTKLTNQEIRKTLVDTLPEIGEHAVKAGSRVMMEPLNRNEAFFLRLLADAASICRDCKSQGIAMMGDFYHMCIEETSDRGAFISAGGYLHHIHMASRTRVLPGQDERSFIDGFRGLKSIGFQDYCSFECGVSGDPIVEIPKSMKFLRDQWEEA
jgi:sugar phosphate isomerase/epimerase